MRVGLRFAFLAIKFFSLFIYPKNVFIGIFIIFKPTEPSAIKKITILVYCANFYVLIWIWILFDVSLTKTVCNLCFIESYGCFLCHHQLMMMTSGDDR